MAAWRAGLTQQKGETYPRPARTVNVDLASQTGKTKTGVEPRNPRASTYSRFERPTAERRIRFGTIFMPGSSSGLATPEYEPATTPADLPVAVVVPVKLGPKREASSQAARSPSVPGPEAI